MSLLWPPLLCAVLLVAVQGPILIPLLRRLKFGQTIREDGPQGHLVKAGTPTMGGLLFLIPVLVCLAIWGYFSAELWLCLLSFIGFGLIGFIDDYLKVVKKRNLGLRAYQKLIGQFAVMVAILILTNTLTSRGTDLVIPISGYDWELGFWYYPLISFFLVGMVNAVNLTDGLDGLATGTCFIAFLCYFLIAATEIVYPAISEVNYQTVAVFAIAMAGVCLGFLFFNRYPAKLFMGDTGSLSLGGALVICAVLTKTEIVLIFIGGIFLIEALSVILQVASFKLTGKRIFKMSPLHHHFELSGWRETKVVIVFWLVAAIFGMLGLLIATL